MMIMITMSMIMITMEIVHVRGITIIHVEHQILRRIMLVIMQQMMITTTTNLTMIHRVRIMKIVMIVHQMIADKIVSMIEYKMIVIERGIRQEIVLQLRPFPILRVALRYVVLMVMV
uniref:Putative secreted protein n=1 Tax=Nyssomyia neivai TaxID=330878 RepID=A0A1L8DNL0_9DIPT